MEEDQQNLKLEDSSQLVVKNLLIKTDEEVKEEASSSNDKKNETEASKESSEPLQKEEERCKSQTPTPARNSPEPSCAICLEQLQNKSFTDSCFHMFCFTCLVEWSKVKPECPLCKQSFKSIVHNVRSFKEYDQYYINKSRLSENLWACVTDRRFRYSTTLTPERLFGRSQTDYSDRIESAIASHRMRYAPHSVHSIRMYATSQSVRRVPCTFRRRIYEENLWVRPIVSNRIRSISPSFFRQNIACTHRLLPWLNRELLVVMPNNESQISFVIELIMALIVKYEITSQEFYTHIEPYTSSNTAHFIHEFYNFAVSPYESMDSYDRYAQYSSLSFPLTVIQSISSPDSDVIPLTTHESSSRKSAGSESCKRKRQHHSKKKHSKEYRKLKKLILKRNSENNCWESVSLVPFMSHNVPRSNPFEVPGPSTSRDPYAVCPAETSNQELDESNEVECLEGIDDDECQVLEVLKPKRERTPEVVDLSSDNEQENVIDVTLHDFSDDTDISSSVEICANKSGPAIVNVSAENTSDDDIVFVSVSKLDNAISDKPIDYSFKPSGAKAENVKNQEVEPCSSNSRYAEYGISQLKNSSIHDLINDDTGSSSLSPFVRPKKRRAVILDDSSTESCSETTQVTELNSRIKKLKLRSVVAHFSFDPSDEHNDSTHHSSSHKKHKEKKKKKKKHKHKRHIYSSESN